MKKLHWLLIITLIRVLPCFGQIYVDQDATGANVGTSWTDAFVNLQDALAVAQPGDQIWVAEGMYIPTECNPCSREQKLIAFEIPSDVQVYGGFAGNENQLEQRDWEARQTILSGNIGDPADSTDNAFSVVTAINSSANTRLDGFVIEHGFADDPENTPGADFFDTFGGGMFVTAETNQTNAIQISQCLFRLNYGGGGGALAIYNHISGSNQSIISQCIFEDNKSSLRSVSSGGAVVLVGSSDQLMSTQILGCIFRNNFNGGFGGGAFSCSTFGNQISFVVDSCLFENNQSEGQGGSVYFRNTSGSSNSVIKNSRFINNTSGGQGGAIFARASFDGISDDLISRCYFSGNVSDGSNEFRESEGGAIYLRGSQGGNGSYTLFNCVFNQNQAQSKGGALATTSSVSGGGTCTVDVINCTFYGNTTPGDGGAVHAEGTAGLNQTRIINSILWGNLAGSQGKEIFNQEADLSLKNSIVEGDLPPDVTDQGQNLSVDPRFYQPDQQDFRLLGCSPAINAGLMELLPEDKQDQDQDGDTLELVPLDFLGNSRLFEQQIDMGAIEWDGAPAKFDSLVFDPVQDAEEDLCNGSVKVTPFNGTPGYQFLWSNQEVSDQLTDLCPGVYTVTVSDSFNCQVTDSIAIAEIPVNDPPSFTSDPLLEAQEDSLYQYTITTDDPDIQDKLTISAVDIPAWLELVDQGDGTALISGIPLNQDVGIHTVLLQVADTTGALAEQQFEIEVRNTNDPPVFTSTPVTEVDQGQLYTYPVTAIDPDLNAILVISAEADLPEWLALQDQGDGSATLSGNPGPDDLGEHLVNLLVQDQELASDSQSFIINVNKVNLAPEFTSEPLLVVYQDDLYQYVITASDPNSVDQLSITASNLPDWLNLTDQGDAQALLEGQPTNDDIGIYQITLQVADSENLKVEQQFQLEVINVNDPPQFSSTPITQVNEGDPYRYLIQVTDPDTNEKLIIEAILIPEWLTIQDQNAGTAVLEGNVPADAGGDYTIELKVEDDSGAVDQQDFILEVLPVNQPPVFTSTPELTVEENAEFTYEIVGADPDTGDQLSITAVNIPEWLELETENNNTILTGTAPPLAGNQYQVILRLEDQSGAFVLQEFFIEILPGQDEIFQSAITPNGDDINDTWKIEIIQNCSDCKVEVFNRWGNKVFSSIGYLQEWDGTWQGALLPAGTYYYVIDLADGQPPKTGSISVLR
ncbi:MAG: putative Ig domain-containing protein [Candidatus Cyclobacteriaceae bacterium M3_2C_046]